MANSMILLRQYFIFIGISVFELLLLISLLLCKLTECKPLCLHFGNKIFQYFKIDKVFTNCSRTLKKFTGRI